MDRDLLVALVRDVLAQVRRQITAGETMTVTSVGEDSVEELIAAEAGRHVTAFAAGGSQCYRRDSAHQPRACAAVRARLLDAIRNAATQYSNLEYSLEARLRAVNADEHTRELLARLTGAEDAHRGEQLRGGGVAGAGGTGEDPAK